MSNAHEKKHWGKNLRSNKSIWHWLGQTDRGSMTVVGAALVMACALLIVAVVMGANVLLNHARAQSAADMAAIAGAQALREGQDACSAVHRVLQANAADLQSCEVIADDVLVIAARDVILPFLQHTSARARAGPMPCGQSQEITPSAARLRGICFATTNGMW
ncbi:pilus biosynthesis protein TadE [Bifidobacterium dolichotidis]|uniref:Pilus biosynthesis protein TadE n=1 Tax=Bifidobacterium dolichotidis TaxID=2306976 RepID=A0A430FQR6_9BIFI|nr:Rv3654c family TadE-like protein [Bifidobacterium dolichotidis]RSX55158.1 pilus biosynthesis protein TadE [Bifidobacterium dolichotidis]